MLQLVLVNYFVRLFSKMFKQMLDIAQWSSFECINSGEQSNPSEQASSLETNSEKDNNKEKMRYERTLVVAALLFAAHPVHVESVASIVGRAELLACLCTFGALDCVSRYAAVLVVRNAEHSHAGKGWFATSLACCTLGCACKETALMSFLLVIVYTAIVTAVAYQQSRQQQQKLSKQLKHREHKARERRVRVVKIMLRQVIIWSTVTLIATLLIRAAISMQWPHLSGHLGPDMTVKIWWPQFRFSTADNPLLKLDTILPTSLVDRWLTRLHVPAFAFSLVVWPKQLSYDWPLEAIQLTSMSWRQFANLLKLETSVIGSSEQSLSSLAITPTPTMFKGPHDFYPGPSSIHSIESDKENNCNNDERPSSRSSLDSALGTSNSSSSSVSTSSTIDHVSVNNLALTHYRDIYRCPNEATATAQLGLITLALLFALLTYLPASNLIVHVGFVVAERTLYMPSVGVTILMGVAYETSIHYCHQKLFEDSNKSVRDMFYYIILVPIVLMLVMSSIERTKVWHDPISLYSSNVALNPAKSLANIGHVLASNNQLDEAEQHYKNALNIWPNQADVHLNLGLLLHKQGRIAEAIEAYNIALRYRPRLALARLNLGLAHEQSAPPGTADTRRLALEMYLITVNDTVTGAPELSKDPETQALAQLQAAIRALRLIDAKWSSNSNLLTLHYLDVVKTVAQFEHRLRSTTLQWSSKPELIDLHLQLMLLLIDHSPQVFISGLQGYLERSISDDDSSALEASDDLLDLLTRPHLFPRFTTKADQRSKDNDVEAKFALRHRLIEKLRQQGGRISSPDSRLMYAHGKLLQLWLDHYNHEAVVGASVTRHTVAQLALETIHTFNRNNQQYTNNKDTMKRKIHNYHLLAFAADAHNQAQDFNTSERLYDDALAAMKDLSQFEGSRARANIISTLLAQAHLNYGAILHRRAKYREARAQYEATLKLDPEHEMARTNLQRLPVK
ncbi:Protein O-mannosyl-transferase TMTC2 [Fragariocoptes setiger]|uniref:dolichyl-phosphate-mannose--protein mannosyltransferase n=1 Tax=Fragariocoptes setiger TaxID=1670756 RepID=A0ABQ7S8C6_9ACAR|nr:Protein O-mannosyl-transferase TMTC2 [Fragariocoptes setiger]